MVRLPNMTRTGFVMCLIAAAIALSGCAGTASQTAMAGAHDSRNASAGRSNGTINVEAAIAHIHALYNERKLKALFALATERMQQRMARPQFLDVIKHVRHTLGAARSFKVIEQKSLPGGKRRVVVRVQYEHGSGTERWVLQFSEHGVQWSAFVYHAPALVKKAL